MRALVLAFTVAVAAPSFAQIPFLPGSPRDRQRAAAKGLYPTAIALAPAGARAAEEVRTIRVRAHATRDHRTFNWQSRFKRLVERVNRLVERWPGVRFEVVEVRPWDRDTGDASLSALLGELEARDAGQDVDLVVGLVGAMARFPTSVEDAGRARLVSRHFVMRSLHDLAGYQSLRTGLDELGDAERDALVTARKLHGEEVLFLHEWGHTLGLPHAERASAIMASELRATAGAFGPVEGRIVELALARLGDVAAIRAAIRPVVERTPDPDWDGGARAQLLAALAGGPAPAPAEPPRAAVEEDTAAAALRRAEALVTAGRVADAPAALAAAQARLEREAGAPPEAWRALAELYRRFGAPTLAEQAARRSGGEAAREIAAWAQTTRRRTGVPDEAAALGLAPADEPAYVRAVALARETLEDPRRIDTAAMLIAQVRRDWPRLPGADVLECQRLFSLGQRPAALAACGRALAVYPDAVIAVALTGLLQAAPKAAIPHLRRAIALDPEAKVAWRALADAYRRGRDAAGLEALRAEHQQRFGAPLD